MYVLRFECAVCPNLQLCTGCEAGLARGAGPGKRKSCLHGHSVTHPLIKHRVPVPADNRSAHRPDPRFSSVVRQLLARLAAAANNIQR